MSRRTRLVPLAASLGFLLVAGGLVACSPQSIIEGAIEDQTGVKVDEDSGTITFRDDDGTTAEISGSDEDGWLTITDGDGSVYTQGEGIPADFPSNVPLVNLPVTYGISNIAADGAETFMITMESPKDCSGVFDDATAKLAGAGYAEESKSVMDSSDGSWAFATYGGPYRVNVTVSDDDAACMVNYTVESM